MCLSVQGKRTDAPEHKGVRGLRHHAECLQVADVVIEAPWVHMASEFCMTGKGNFVALCQ